MSKLFAMKYKCENGFLDLDFCVLSRLVPIHLFDVQQSEIQLSSYYVHFQ